MKAPVQPEVGAGGSGQPGWRGRVVARLASMAPASAWRVVAASAATLLTVLATTGGLFFHARELQIGVVAGACAALIAPSRRWAAVVAGAATLAGAALGPASAWGPEPAWSAKLAGALAAAAIAALAAVAVRASAVRTPRAGRRVVWGVVGLLVANAWITTITVAGAPETNAAGQQVPSLVQLLSGEVVVSPQGGTGDLFAFLQVLKDVRGGEPFYRSWHDELGPKQWAGASAGASVVNYHLPTPFLLWAVLPGSPVSVVYAYLVLVSVTTLAVPFLVRGTVRFPLAVPGAAAVTAYLFAYGYWLSVLSAEAWAGALAVLSAAAWVRSGSARRWKAWTVAAVALGVSAALFREPAVLVPVAGLASSLMLRDRGRRFRTAAWATGLAAFATAYAVHWANVRPWLSGTSPGAAIKLSGLDTIVSALTYGTPALGASSVVPLVLAAVGLAGIVFTGDPRSRLFIGLTVFVSLLAYLFVDNGALDFRTRAPINYWGAVIVPVIYACVPAAFAVLPGMSSRGTGQSA